MIEIKVDTMDDKGSKQKISVESRAKHSGTYGAFVREMSAIFGTLDKIDHGVFIVAITDYLMVKAVDSTKKCDESEDEDE